MLKIVAVSRSSPAWERECALRQAQGTGDNKPVVEPVETNQVSGSYLFPVPQQATTLYQCLCDSLQDLRSQAGAWEQECALRQAQGTGDNKPVVEPVETNHVSGSYLLPVPQQASACKACVPKPELGNEWEKSLIPESGFGQLCHAERLVTTRTLPRQIRSDTDGSALIIRFRHHHHRPGQLPPRQFQMTSYCFL
ncbi:MAG: hypothetical protein B6245_09045 [Desulfobacteraceae bacterium 4572_88]|nr:MAG: hypothetical protein B6245_09045 [Desulfobacteraceae bacterium 4572_88]